MRIQSLINFNRVYQILLKLAILCQNLLQLCQNFVTTLLQLAATLPELAATLPKLAVTCHKLIKLAEFSRIHLSSVSLRHSYCNQASPVTQCFNIKLGNQFFLKYKDKLATSIRDNCFRESIKFLYMVQEQLSNSRC